jgi:hypothetical protein
MANNQTTTAPVKTQDPAQTSEAKSTLTDTNAPKVGATLVEAAQKDLANAQKSPEIDINPDIKKYDAYISGEHAVFKNAAAQQLRQEVSTTLNNVEEFKVDAGESDGIKQVQALLRELKIFGGELNGKGSPELVAALRTAKTMVGVGLSVKADMFGATTALAIETYLQKQRDEEAAKAATPTPEPSPTPQPTPTPTPTPEKTENKSKDTATEVSKEVIIERKDPSDPFSPLVRKTKSDFPQTETELTPEKKKQKEEEGTFLDLLKNTPTAGA